MNELQIFNSPEFGDIRTVAVDGEPWFVGKDVAKALGYSDTDQALRKHVDNEDKLTRQFDGSGQSRSMTIINESGVYSLIPAGPAVCWPWRTGRQSSRFRARRPGSGGCGP